MTQRFSTRRNVLSTIGAAAAIGVAGVGSAQQSGGNALSAGGSSTVYPVASDAGSYWNSNPPASDEEYWGPNQYGYQTQKNLADYWGGLYGFSTGGDANVPFPVTVGLSHSGVGVTKLMNQQVDIADSSAPVKAELPDADQSTLDNFVDHVVGVDAQPLVVSREVYSAGVEQLTLQQVKDIYKGKTENWSELGGPDKEIQAVGRAEGSGTDTAFRLNVFGSPDAAIPGVDVRKGQNQQVQTLVANSDNAIAYIALAFLEPDGQVPPVDLKIDDTVYTYGKNLDAKAYPLSRDLHMYTWKGTSKKEAAYLVMILSNFGQKNFVEANDYVTLSPKRQRTQMDKLPEPQGASMDQFVGGNSSSGGGSNGGTTTGDGSGSLAK